MSSAALTPGPWPSCPGHSLWPGTAPCLLGSPVALWSPPPPLRRRGSSCPLPAHCPAPQLGDHCPPGRFHLADLRASAGQPPPRSFPGVLASCVLRTDLGKVVSAKACRGRTANTAVHTELHWCPQIGDSPRGEDRFPQALCTLVEGRTQHSAQKQKEGSSSKVETSPARSQRNKVTQEVPGTCSANDNLPHPCGTHIGRDSAREAGHQSTSQW